MKFTTMSLWILSLLPGAALSASGQQERGERPSRPALRVTGEATVSVRPDRAKIDIGVVTQGETAESAAAQNARSLETVLQQVRVILGSGADIRTAGYSIQPVYRYPREGGKPTITGYNAHNTVRVTIDDLSLVGKVIDAATRSGANTIQSLQFTLKDELAVQTQALREAALKAKSKAEALVSALGLRYVRVLHIEEGGGGVLPMQERTMALGAAELSGQTPVEAGTIEVRATVTLTIEIAQ